MAVYPGTSNAFWFVFLIAAYEECYLANFLAKSKVWSEQVSQRNAYFTASNKLKKKKKICALPSESHSCPQIVSMFASHY